MNCTTCGKAISECGNCGLRLTKPVFIIASRKTGKTNELVKIVAALIISGAYTREEFEQFGPNDDTFRTSVDKRVAELLSNDPTIPAPPVVTRAPNNETQTFEEPQSHNLLEFDNLDISLIMVHTGASEAAAMEALRQANGDTVNAIVALTKY